MVDIWILLHKLWIDIEDQAWSGLGFREISFGKMIKWRHSGRQVGISVVQMSLDKDSDRQEY